MKKLVFFSTIILLLFAFTFPAVAQFSPFSWSQVTAKVLREGILYPEPEDYFVFFDEFFAWDIPDTNSMLLTVDDGGWIATVVSAGTGDTTPSIFDGTGGILRVVTAANENDGANIQWSSECFIPSETQKITFEARVKVSDITQSDFMLGLTDLDTTALADPTDGIFFLKVDGETLIDAINVINTTTTADTTSTAVAFVANTWTTFKFEWNTKTVKYFIDNVLVATHDTVANVPTDAELTPTICYLCGAAGVDTLYVDYIYCKQDR